MRTQSNAPRIWQGIGLFILLAGIFLIGVFVTSKNAAGDIRSRASATRSCPAIGTEKFTPAAIIPSLGLSYPAVVKSGSTYLLFAGGLDTQLAAALAGVRPGGYRYAGFQEEIWRFQSDDPQLIKWKSPTFSFGILPDTPVSFKANAPYKDVYPKGFMQSCTVAGKTACNVQINDPSVVSYNGALYMYFSMLENYRWYDGTLGNLTASGPTNPKEQNIHAIGLAVSGDNGAHWAFVDKVIPETGVIAETNGKNEAVLGAWAPSAIVSGDGVDVYFHDATGTKQYLTHLKGGVARTTVQRLNQFDVKYRVNLDVTDHGSYREILYNDERFNIVKMRINTTQQYGLCPSTVLVPSGVSKYPTPHQVIVNGKRHLFFWEFGNPSVIHHWIEQ